MTPQQVQHVQGVLQDIVAQLLLNKPDEPVPEIIQFLQDLKGTGAPPLSKEERTELNRLRDEYEKLKNQKKKVKKESSDSEAEEGKNGSSSDSEGDPVAELDVAKKLNLAKKSRTSVSAEVFGKYHVKAAFKPKIIPKSQ